MLLSSEKFGGIIPKVYDPRLIPEGKGQIAKNCRFVHGGVMPLDQDTVVNTPTKAGPLKSIYLYDSKWLSWTGDVDVAKSPIANDSYQRLYWTGDGTPKMATKSLIETGGTNYPNNSYDLGIPAPVHALTAGPRTNWTQQTLPASGDWSVAYGAGFFVAVLYASSIAATSPDGITWTQRTLPVSAYWTDICYANGQFVAIANTTIAATSPDGITWTQRTLPGPYSWWSIAASSSVYVAVVFASNKAATSPDGITWTEHDMPSGFTAGGIASGNGIFVAMSSVKSDAIVTSPDGITWTQRTLPAGIAIRQNGITFGNGAFVAVSQDSNANVAVTSEDGIVWAAHEMGTQVGSWGTIAYGSGSFVALSFAATNKLAVSSDNGKTWSEQLLATTQPWQSIAFSGSAFIATPNASAVANRLTNLNLYQQETRSYVYRYLSAYGEPGPPSPASDTIDVYDGSPAILTGIDGAPAGNHNITQVEIFRTNLDANGNEQYQHVDTIAIGTTTYSDGIGNDALGEVLNSLLWDAPLSDMTGLISLPNAGLAGFTGNIVCFSVPGFPHAWPYQKTTDRPVIGCGVYGQSVIVLTDAYPYIVSGISQTTPDNFTMEKVDSGYGCVSKRSIVDMGQFIAYAAPEGLVAVGPGLNKNLTQDLFEPEDWQAFKPSSISGYLWQGKYVGFYDTGTVQAGFIFDPKTNDFVPLDFYDTGGYRDPVTGNLYLVVGSNIVSFCTANTFRSMDHKGKRYTYHPTAFTAVKVLATSYPVSMDIIYPASPLVPAGQTVSVSISSSSPQRISSLMSDNCELRLYGGATAAYLASTLEELPL